MGPPSHPPVPVNKSQGLRVGGGNNEADSWGTQLLPGAICQLPVLPIVLLQSVAIAPRDQALVVGQTRPLRFTSGLKAQCPLPQSYSASSSGHRVKWSQLKGALLMLPPASTAGVLSLQVCASSMAGFCNAEDSRASCMLNQCSTHGATSPLPSFTLGNHPFLPLVRVGYLFYSPVSRWTIWWRSGQREVGNPSTTGIG